MLWGCIIHSNEHKEYETELGIPQWLALLEKTLFEGMPNERAKEFRILFFKQKKHKINISKNE